VVDGRPQGRSRTAGQDREPGSAASAKADEAGKGREGRRRGKEEIDGRPVFTHFFIDRPILSSVIFAAHRARGRGVAVVLSIEQYPEMAPPEVTIDAIYPGATAEVIASNVAAPIEVQMNGIDRPALLLLD